MGQNKDAIVPFDLPARSSLPEMIVFSSLGLVPIIAILMGVWLGRRDRYPSWLKVFGLSWVLFASIFLCLTFLAVWIEHKDRQRWRIGFLGIGTPARIEIKPDGTQEVLTEDGRIFRLPPDTRDDPYEIYVQLCMAGGIVASGLTVVSRGVTHRRWNRKREVGQVE